MSLGFFLDIAKNTGNLFLYGISPVKDVVDIPLRHHYPIVRNIVRPRNLDCNSAPIVRESNKRSNSWNAKGEELFSYEELEPQLIPDRYKYIPHVTEHKSRQLTSDQSSKHTDIRDRDTLTQIDGRIPTIPEEPSEDSLLAVLEEQSDEVSSLLYKNKVPECPREIYLEPVPKHHRSKFHHSKCDSLPIIF